MFNKDFLEVFHYCSSDVHSHLCLRTISQVPEHIVTYEQQGHLGPPLLAWSLEGGADQICDGAYFLLGIGWSATHSAAGFQQIT